MLVAHNGDLKAAKCGLSTAAPPKEHGPSQKTDLKADGDWDAVGNSIIEVAKKIGC
jgi:2-haloacid dehalogenase